MAAGPAGHRRADPRAPGGWRTWRTTSPGSRSRWPPASSRALDAVSAPALNYPAIVNGELRATLQFAGCTVDGEASGVYPPLLLSDVRY